MAASSHTVTVGAYLATRLRQLGVTHMFGLPGDFNLSLIDEMLGATDLAWVGTANELNAAYAADSYARVRRGLGVVMTTLGVGELSAINGVAGAAAEDVPLLQITGTAPASAIAEGKLLHHTLGDGDFHRFMRAYAEVTADARLLDHEDAAADIDAVLTQALTTLQPVYLAIPQDIATAPVDASRLGTPLDVPRSEEKALRQWEAALADALAGAADVTILAGSQLHRLGLEPAMRRIADLPGVRVASQSGSKAIIDESHPHSLGTYIGALTPTPATRAAVDEAAPLVLAGAVLSDLLTGGFTHGFDPDDAIALGVAEARLGAARYPRVLLGDALAALERVLARRSQTRHTPAPGTDAAAATQRPAVPEDGALSQEGFWQVVQSRLRPEDLIIADAGTAYYGALELTLPDRADLIGQPLWSSIGYSVPAALGAGIAAPSRRVVLLVGDGAAQLTIQDMATILHRGLTPVVILLNNGGYTVERAIQSPDAVYQDITTWDWPALVTALSPAHPPHTHTVGTATELDAAWESAEAEQRAVFIEARLAPDDAPELLRRIAGGLRPASGGDAG